jgi:hypothetical protein
MPTKFTPVTTQQLAPVQKNAELDGMIEIVQGLIQQRQSSQDRQFTLGQRDRLISGQAKEDEQSAAKTESLTLFNEYMTKGGHTLKDVENLAITGHLDKNQISAIQTSATDYRSDNMKLSDFSKLLPDIRDEKELADAIAETDVNESTAFRLWKEKQQREALLAKAAADAKAGSGTGKGKGTEGEGELLVGQAGAENTKQLMRTTGMNFGSYNVMIYGTDLKPEAVLTDTKGSKVRKFKKTADGLYGLSRDGNTWVKLQRKKNGWSATGGNIPGSDTVHNDIIDSLNKGYTEFQDSNIGARGKKADLISEDFNRRFKP